MKSPEPLSPRQIRARNSTMAMLGLSLVLFGGNTVGFLVDHFPLEMPIGNVGLAFGCGYFLLSQKKSLLGFALLGASMLCSLGSIALLGIHR